MAKYERETAEILLGELRRALETAKALDRAGAGAALWEDRVAGLVTILENELHVLPQSHEDGFRKLEHLIQKRRERE